MNNEIKEIREYIACPQFGDDHYGKWGALRLDQRIKIKELLDYITNLQEENKILKETNICVGCNNKMQDRLDTLKIEISSLMSRYFYEKDFCIEDTHLDKLLRIIDGDNILEGDDKE